MDKSKPYIKPFNAFKPRPFENKNYIIEEKIDVDNIIKIYSDFVTLPYNDINEYFNKNLIFNFRNEDGRTLITAVLTNSGLNEQEKKLIIEKLIHLNVSINAHDCYNQTPLHIACQKGYNSIIQLLIEHKIMKDTVDNYGNAPVHYYIDNFLKECKNSDIFNNKKLLITSEEKTNSTIITHLLLAEILERFNNDPDLKKYNNIIKKLVDLIPYYKISDINTKVDDVKKKINDLYTNISNININKDVNKLVNNFNDDIYKIYDEYKLSDNFLENIYDKTEFDKNIDIELIDKNNNNIKKEYAELKNIIDDVKNNIFSENNNDGLFNNSINCITMSLFILMYIKYNKDELVEELKIIINDVINNKEEHEKLTKELQRLSNKPVANLTPEEINKIAQLQVDIHNLIQISVLEIDVLANKIFNKIVKSIDKYVSHYNSKTTTFEFYNYLTKQVVVDLNKITSKGLDKNIGIKLPRSISTIGSNDKDKQFSLTYDKDRISGIKKIAEIAKKEDFFKYDSEYIDFNNIPSYTYKYNNIHFIFKLLYKIFNNNLDLDLDLDIKNISYNNILTIYNKYELIICIINNLVLIYKHIDTIENDDLIQLQTTFDDIKKAFSYYHNNIEINFLLFTENTNIGLCEFFMNFINDYKKNIQVLKKILIKFILNLDL